MATRISAAGSSRDPPLPLRGAETAARLLLPLVRGVIRKVRDPITANPCGLARTLNEVIDAVGLLADEMNQLAMGVETLSQRRVEYRQPYANGVFERARKLRNNIAHLIPDEAE